MEDRRQMTDDRGRRMDCSNRFLSYARNDGKDGFPLLRPFGYAPFDRLRAGRAGFFRLGQVSRE